MKLARKLSLLIVLAVIVTIGGVYSQWVYQETYVGSVSGGTGVSMQAYLNAGNQQGYFTEKYNTMTLNIADDLDANGNKVDSGAAGDYAAEISGTGGLLFLFQPYVQTTGAEMNTLTFDVEFAEASSILYEGISVFEYTKGTGKRLTKLTEADIAALNVKYPGVELTTSDLGSNSKLGLYYFEITFDQLVAEYVSFSDEFEAINQIDTLQKWDALNTAVKDGKFTVTVSDTREALEN